MNLRPRFSSVIDGRSLVAWLILALVVLLAFRSTVRGQAPASVRPARLPEFVFQAVDGKPVTKQSLKAGVATVVLFFDPECDHCQKQAQWIAAANAQLKGVQFLWVSTAEAAQIKGFGPKYLAGSQLTHLFAKDGKYQFDGWFGYSVAPTLLAFDKSGKFCKAWSNEVAADEIAAALK